MPRLTPKASSRPTTTRPRLIAAPRRPALASRKPRIVVARPGVARRASQATMPPRRRTRSSVAPIHSRAGPKNMYTDSESVGLESGFTTAEKPVRAVSQ